MSACASISSECWYSSICVSVGRSSAGGGGGGALGGGGGAAAGGGGGGGGVDIGSPCGGCDAGQWWVRRHERGFGGDVTELIR